MQAPESAAAVMAYQARLQELQALDQWTLKGRLAISDGMEGGSGNLIWRHDGDRTRMSFHGAMGKGAWQLQADPSGARIELANGRVRDAATIAALVLQEVGWQVPVDALSWWVKGLADPAKWESRELNGHGQLVKLSQFGWEVEFGEYDEVSGSMLPSKLTARRGKYLVKMVVRNWELKAEAG
jgi:outer membrane lipoprotein LolB